MIKREVGNVKLIIKAVVLDGRESKAIYGEYQHNCRGVLMLKSFFQPEVEKGERLKSIELHIIACSGKLLKRTFEDVCCIWVCERHADRKEAEWRTIFTFKHTAESEIGA